jgi:ABC-type nitrate/sulfonate/bicarbonate transport system permease component
MERSRIGQARAVVVGEATPAERDATPASARATVSSTMDETEIARVEEAFARTQRRISQKNATRQIVLNVVGVAIFLAIWEILPRSISGLNLLLFPPPSGIVDALRDLLSSGDLLWDAAASIARALGGFAVGGVLGILVGLLTARVAPLRFMSDPVLHGFRSIPAIALVPLAVVWFGIGEMSKIALITWGTFFPVWINTYLGARDVNPAFIRSAQSLGVGSASLLVRVILPGALPLILAGLRQSLAIALVVMVAAELVGASVGLGQLIASAQQIFRIDHMFVGLLALGAIGFALDHLFVLVAHHLFPWYGRT